jgi:hypothetical protein
VNRRIFLKTLAEVAGAASLASVANPATKAVYAAERHRAKIAEAT